MYCGEGRSPEKVIILYTYLLVLLHTIFVKHFWYTSLSYSIYCMNYSTSYICMNVHFSIIKPKPNKGVAKSKHPLKLIRSKLGNNKIQGYLFKN